jgi:hypothetical protein
MLSSFCLCLPTLYKSCPHPLSSLSVSSNCQSSICLKILHLYAIAMNLSLILSIELRSQMASAADHSAVRAHKRLAALTSHLTPALVGAASASVQSMSCNNSTAPAAVDLSALENVKVEKKGRVAIVQMHRPSALVGGCWGCLLTAVGWVAESDCLCVVFVGVVFRTL